MIFDITEEKLIGWKNVAINRLSIGIQSFFDDDLKWMNRAHTAAESIACIDLIKAAGFTNFSVDLIYGSPILTDDDWKRKFKNKNPESFREINRRFPRLSKYNLEL